MVRKSKTYASPPYVYANHTLRGGFLRIRGGR
jgi:hypothetical protein